VTEVDVGNIPQLDRHGSVPLHAQIREALLEVIGGVAAGHQLPTEKELAAHFGVSRLTVHKAMADLRDDGYIERRRGGGSFVRERERQIHTVARCEAGGSFLIAYPDWFSHDLWAKVQSAESLALRHGLKLLHLRIRRETSYGALRKLCAAAGDVRGVLVIPPGAALDRGNLAALDALGVPVAVLVACEYGSLVRNIGFISQDGFKAGYMAVELLLRRGHRRLGYVANEPPHHGSRLFHAGMKKAIADAGLPARSLRRCADNVRPWEDSMAAGCRLTRRLLADERPTAAVFDSFPGCMGGLRALRESGVDVPREMSLLSIDHYGDFPRYLWPAVTSLASTPHAIMEAAFDWLTGPAEGRQKNVLVDVELRERESVVSPATAARDTVTSPAGPEERREKDATQDETQ
jgi:DNA-binding LacI/PurR family transcriptional regulator